MRQHKIGAYVYASTQTFVTDASGSRKRRCVHWGTLEDGKKFVPNTRYLMLTLDEREKFVFPSNWDLSELSNLPSERNCGRPAYVDADQDRHYGDIWLLEQLAERLGLYHDLEEVFGGNKEKALDVLSLAMFSCLSQKAFCHMAACQLDGRYPAVHALEPSDITMIMQSITEAERMELFRRRRRRVRRGSLCAVDSTSRSGYGAKLSLLAYGHSKDHLPLPQTSETVVYCLTTHEPIYYRTFQGNLPDCRSLRVILPELKHAGFKDLILITDRGYETQQNLTLCILKSQKLITAAKAGQKRIRKKIRELAPFLVEPNGHSMHWIPRYEVYASQFDIDMSVKGPGGKRTKANRLKLNLYLDMRRRTDELTNLENKLAEQERELRELKKKKQAFPDSGRQKYPLFQIGCDPKTNAIISFERRADKIARIRETFGFFALYTLGLRITPEEALEDYRLRDEQEKYFNSMKTRLGDDRQWVSTDKSLVGRRLVEFVGLILISAITRVWTESEPLRNQFRTVEDMFLEMRRIHCLEHRGHTKILTPFVGRQLAICQEFGFDVPPGCAPAYMKVE